MLSFHIKVFKINVHFTEFLHLQSEIDLLEITDRGFQCSIEFGAPLYNPLNSDISGLDECIFSQLDPSTDRRKKSKALFALDFVFT